MKLTKFAFQAAGALFAAAAMTLAGASRADDSPVMLKHTDKAGDTQHQQVVIKTQVAGMDVLLKQTMKRTVKQVSDSGDVTLVVTDEGGTLTLNGSDMPQETAPEITIKRDKLGKLTDWKPAKDIEGQGLSPEVLRASEQLYTVVLPSTAVKEKDTWKVELDNPIYDKAKIKLENTYLGIDKVDGVDQWKIKQTGSVPTDGEGGVTTFEVTFWLNPASGQTTKVEATVKDLPSQFGKISLNVSLSGVKEVKTPANAPAADKKAPN